MCWDDLQEKDSKRPLYLHHRGVPSSDIIIAECMARTALRRRRVTIIRSHCFLLERTGNGEQESPLLSSPKSRPLELARR